MKLGLAFLQIGGSSLALITVSTPRPISLIAGACFLVVYIYSLIRYQSP